MKWLAWLNDGRLLVVEERDLPSFRARCRAERIGYSLNWHWRQCDICTDNLVLGPDNISEPTCLGCPHNLNGSTHPDDPGLATTPGPKTQEDTMRYLDDSGDRDLMAKEAKREEAAANAHEHYGRLLDELRWLRAEGRDAEADALNERLKELDKEPLY